MLDFFVLQISFLMRFLYIQNHHSRPPFFISSWPVFSLPFAITAQTLLSIASLFNLVDILKHRNFLCLFWLGICTLLRHSLIQLLDHSATDGALGYTFSLLFVSSTWILFQIHGSRRPKTIVQSQPSKYPTKSVEDIPITDLAPNTTNSTDTIAFDLDKALESLRPDTPLSTRFRQLPDLSKTQGNPRSLIGSFPTPKASRLSVLLQDRYEEDPSYASLQRVFNAFSIATDDEASLNGAGSSHSLIHSMRHNCLSCIAWIRLHRDALVLALGLCLIRLAIFQSEHSSTPSSSRMAVAMLLAISRFIRGASFYLKFTKFVRLLVDFALMLRLLHLFGLAPANLPVLAPISFDLLFMSLRF